MGLGYSSVGPASHVDGARATEHALAQVGSECKKLSFPLRGTYARGEPRFRPPSVVNCVRRRHMCRACIYCVPVLQCPKVSLTPLPKGPQVQSFKTGKETGTLHQLADDMVVS